MASTIHGTLPPNRQRHKITKSAEGLTKQVVIIVAWTGYTSSIPAIGDADAEDAGFYVSTVEVERKGEEAEITINYVTRGTLSGLPATTFVESSSTMERPIQTHPDFGDWSADWDNDLGAFKPTSSKYGIDSYIVGTTQVTKTTYHATMPSSDKASIGNKESPGTGFGSSDNWLLIGSNRRQEGYYFVKENTYLWCAKAWDADVYP